MAVRHSSGVVFGAEAAQQRAVGEKKLEKMKKALDRG